MKDTLGFIQQNDLFLPPYEQYKPEHARTQRVLDYLWNTSHILLQYLTPDQYLMLSIPAERIAGNRYLVSEGIEQRILKKLTQAQEEKQMEYERNIVRLAKPGADRIVFVQSYINEKNLKPNLQLDTLNREMIELTKIGDMRYRAAKSSLEEGRQMYYQSRPFNETQPKSAERELVTVPVTNRSINRAVYFLIEGTGLSLYGTDFGTPTATSL